MGKRKGYSPEQCEAREQADNDLRERATELLADPEGVAAMVRQLVEVSRSPKVLHYSLRNQAMLIGQAEAREMTLTDVDSFKGWLNRGRCVSRGERGLRIVAPKGTEASQEETGEQEKPTQPQQPQGAQGEEKAPTVRFRMMTVFDISQTEGAEDAETVGAAEVVPNPAALLRDTLTEQFERRGYRVEVSDTETGAAEVDEADLIVRLPAGAEVAELACALAELVTGREPAPLGG
jgi:N-terminal domain of anti-restriction factor ArdC